MLRNGEGQREAVAENPQLPWFNFMQLQPITYHPSGEKIKRGKLARTPRRLSLR